MKTAPHDHMAEKVKKPYSIYCKISENLEQYASILVLYRLHGSCIQPLSQAVRIYYCEMVLKFEACMGELK